MGREKEREGYSLVVESILVLNLLALPNLSIKSHLSGTLLEEPGPWRFMRNRSKPQVAILFLGCRACPSTRVPAFEFVPS
jgi:hypothetical protein